MSAFALVDANNFFVSCERIFRPELNLRPTVVLSNNDGCVVARSQRIKDIGVPMGQPYFKIEKQLKAINTAVFSANFQLYGDMSWRVNEALKHFSPHIEIYSIDESFLRIDDIPIKDHAAFVREVHQSILKWTGLPVSVGVGTTKTLAKLAADRAKKDPEMRANGGMSLMDASSRPGVPSTREIVLKNAPATDVWGIGPRLGPKLAAIGARSAWDVTQLREETIRKIMTIKGVRTYRELRGESCIDVDENSFDDTQKSLSATRTFGHTTAATPELESAMATFAARVGSKLRRKKQLASELYAYLRTGRHAPQQHYSGQKIRLPYPTADTGQLIKYSIKAMHQIRRSDVAYKKSGLVSYDLVPERSQQIPLMGDTVQKITRDNQLMSTVDIINKKYGKGMVHHAVQGVKTLEWHAVRKNTSPAYTTRWSEIPKVRA